MSQFSYDEVQYESHAYSFTHPEQLYTTARLFGLEAPAFQNAKILELGCASGGNIIPIACQYPECRITGIDLSVKQIENGIKQIKELDLKNIELRHQSIMEIDSKEGPFDYIICHGVYSWVPREVQERILSICRENMIENGVAIISYNTLPGWNGIKSIRDMMLYHIREFNSPKEKAEQARSILHFVYNGLNNSRHEDSENPYLALLKSEIELISQYSDQYLLHDHLESENRPLYFHQFVDSLAEAGLRYLGDAPLANMYHHNLPPEMADELSKLKDIIKIGQYMDFIRNQRFRSTLVCHNNAYVAAHLRRMLNPESMKGYFFSLSPILLKADLPGQMKEQEENHQPVTLIFGKRKMELTDKISQTAFLVLAEQKGRPLSFQKLKDNVRKKLSSTDSQEIEKHLLYTFSITELILAGLLEVYSREIDFSLTITNNPVASPLVRYLAQNKNHVPNQFHTSIPLTVDQRVLIQYLTGEYTQEEIKNRMLDHFKRKELIMQYDDDHPIVDESFIKEYVAKLCERGLKKFLEKALLITPPLNSSPNLY